MNEETLADLKTRLRVALKFDHADLAKVHKLNLEAADAITALQAERDFLRAEIERLTGNKWSKIEIALSDARAYELWRDINRVESKDDFRSRAHAAEQRCARLEAALTRFVTLCTPVILPGESWSEARCIPLAVAVDEARAALEADDAL